MSKYMEFEERERFFASVRDELRRYCRGYGGSTEFAKRNGISPSYLCLVISGQRPPGKKIFAALELERARNGN